jgi:hypothetical protein
MSAEAKNFYVLIQGNNPCLYSDFFHFGFYAKEDNLEAVKDFVEWLKKTAIEGEEEWLNDPSPDKCGLHEWFLSDDPFKNDPVKSKKVTDYLNSFSILSATPQLKQFCMERPQTLEPIPYKLSEDGKADLDMASIEHRHLFKSNAVEVVKSLKTGGCAKALQYIKNLEGVNDDLELAKLLGIPLGKISGICQPGHFLRFFDEHYPYAYEAYLKAKFDERSL